MLRFPIRSLAVLTALASLTACETTERVANTAVDGIEDGAQAVAGVAKDVAGAVADAAGAVYNTAEDVFTSDPDADAVALIRPTSASGASAQGTVRFMEMGDDLMVSVSLSGLAPGVHGLHIHQNPACGRGDADGDGQMEPAGAAGGHWDPMRTNDHGAPTEGMGAKHMGDLGNITVGGDGTVKATITVSGFSPSAHPVVGHAIVVHSGRDDLKSDPSGRSGTPQGCGVIEGRM